MDLRFSPVSVNFFFLMKISKYLKREKYIALTKEITITEKFIDVDFGILEQEVCCGDPAMKLGDELLFHEMVGQNMDKFKNAGVKHILTTSPHCLNVFHRKYKDFEKDFNVKHYTEFLHSALKEKRPKFHKSLSYTVAYHDPCYLGKHNEIYDPPRALINAIPGIKLIEMKITDSSSSTAVILVLVTRGDL